MEVVVAAWGMATAMDGRDKGKGGRGEGERGEEGRSEGEKGRG